MRLRQLTALLDESPDATVAVDVTGRIAEWNPAAEALFGWSRAEILHAPIRSVVPTDVVAAFDTAWNRLAAGFRVPSFDTDRLHRDGTTMGVSVHAIAVRDETGFAGAVATFRQHSASGLLSRRQLQTALAAPIPVGMARGVAVLDVDAFGLVNQTYGPDVGDEVLDQLDTRLGGAPEGVAAGRWQADEFVYVVDADDPTAELERLVQAALSAVREPLTISDQTVYLTMSAGLVCSTVVPSEGLFSAATRALQVAKTGGRDRAVWFDAARRSPSGGGLQLANDLRRGIEAGELRLLFQPIVELTHHEVVGVEALVRWERPGVGLLEPAAFIELAERTGQIVPLGAWVARHACETAAHLAQLSSAPHSMSINLSARQLSDPGVVGMLQGALAATSCAPESIIIEVTETALMHDTPSATATLEAIKALGITLALDDFGIGYNSLLSLKNFPVDRIKIDRSFVAGLGVDGDDTAIVASTVSLAHSVGVKAVAEGVETVDQLTLLRQLGCDFAQGYLFSRPLTLGHLQSWLRDHPPTRRRRAAAPTPISPETGHILRLHRGGASLHTIAAALNVEGKRTALDVRWSPQSVAKVIAVAQYPTIQLPH